MTHTPWTKPVHAFTAPMPVTMVGLWSLLMTGAVAASRLSLVPTLDDDLSLTEASEDLRKAACALESAHPLLPVTGVVLDVGPAPTDDLAGSRSAIRTLIQTSLSIANDLIDRSVLTAPDLLLVRRTVEQLARADRRVLGGPA